jgi:hypothetical protein
MGQVAARGINRELLSNIVAAIWLPKSRFNEKLTIHRGGSERWFLSGRRFDRSSYERKDS